MRRVNWRALGAWIPVVVGALGLPLLLASWIRPNDLSFALGAIGIGLGILGAILGYLANRLGSHSKRYNFLDAHSDLFFLRKDVQAEPAQVEWASWGGNLCCHRASVVWRAATPKERSDFIKDLAVLAAFVMDADPGPGELVRIKHLLMASLELHRLPEMEEPLPGMEDAAGFALAKVFEERLASRGTEEKVVPYLERLYRAVRVIEGERKEKEPVDLEYFRSVLNREQGQVRF